MSTWAVGMNVVVNVKVGDESAILRCTENQDEDGQPQPDVWGSPGWRNTYYPLDTPESVVEHFAFNCISNGAGDASLLDGWADLPAGAVTMCVERVEEDYGAGPRPRPARAAGLVGGGEGPGCAGSAVPPGLCRAGVVSGQGREQTPRERALTKDCPRCREGAGSPCRSVDGSDRILVRVHHERVARAVSWLHG